MEVFRRIAAIAALALALGGCMGYPDRGVVLKELNPAPMSAQVWSQVVGVYAGPVRSASQRGGFEGYSAMDVRLDLSGWADAPTAVLRMENGFSTAWALYGERKGVYTNIPAKRYGSQGTLYLSTHAPDQLLLKTRRFGASAGTGVWMVLTFRENGSVDVDLLGHSGWRGDGELWRVIPMSMAR